MTSSLPGLIAFAVAASITPGPNNVMIAATAANCGFRAAVPQAFGISFGFALMLAVVGLGVAGLLVTLPLLAQALRIVSLAWLLLLAVRIARSGVPGSGPERVPLGFLGAAAFQWVNPKAWFIALGASAAWILPQQPMAPQVAAITGIFLVICVPCVLAWALLGSAASRLLHSSWRLRAFNVSMAMLMVLSMLPVAFGE